MAEVPVAVSSSEEEQFRRNREFFETHTYDKLPTLEKALATTAAAVAEADD
jgi:hypothetical protein